MEREGGERVREEERKNEGERHIGEREKVRKGGREGKGR